MSFGQVGGRINRCFLNVFPLFFIREGVPKAGVSFIISFPARRIFYRVIGGRCTNQFRNLVVVLLLMINDTGFTFLNS